MYLIDPTMEKVPHEKTKQHRSAATRVKTCTVQYKAVTAEAPEGVGYLVLETSRCDRGQETTTASVIRYQLIVLKRRGNTVIRTKNCV